MLLITTERAFYWHAINLQQGKSKSPTEKFIFSISSVSYSPVCPLIHLIWNHLNVTQKRIYCFCLKTHLEVSPSPSAMSHQRKTMRWKCSSWTPPQTDPQTDRVSCCSVSLALVPGFRCGKFTPGRCSIECVHRFSALCLHSFWLNLLWFALLLPKK